MVEQDGQREDIPADVVVIAIGSKSNRFEEIKATCNAQSIALHVVGDAVRPRRVIDAIAESSELP